MSASTTAAITAGCVILYLASFAVGNTRLRRQWLEERGLSAGGPVTGVSFEWQAYVTGIIRADSLASILVKLSMLSFVGALLFLLIGAALGDLPVGRAGLAAFESLTVALQITSRVRIHGLLRQDEEGGRDGRS